MSRVLVTGSSGFVGRHLVHALAARGHEVVCVSRRPPTDANPCDHNVTHYCGDVTEPASLNGQMARLDTVYHVAGRTRTLECDEFWRVNAAGVENVAAACARQATPPVLVCVSSLAAVGPTSDRPVTEADRPHPISEYGRSKLAGEQAAAKWAARAPITIVRPAAVFGEGDPAGLLMFQMIARFGLHFTPCIARHRYSLIHVADLVEMLLLAADRGTRLTAEAYDWLAMGWHVAARSKGRGCLVTTPHAALGDVRPQIPACGHGQPSGIYFAATDDIAFAELGRLIGQALGRRSVVAFHIAAPLLWLAAAAGEVLGRWSGRPHFVNLDKAREAVAGSWLCSAARAHRELGFRPTAALTERLRQTVAGYRRAGWL